MKRIQLIVVSIFFVGIFAVSAFSQVVAPSKVALIQTAMFYDETSGIKKLAVANQKLEAEFKPAFDQLQSMQDRLTRLQGELAVMQENISKGLPVDKEAARAKNTEFEKLKLEYEFKTNDTKANLERRDGEMNEPILTDLSRKLNDYSKSKGYDVLLDASALRQNRSILYWSDSIDITVAFIAYYNAQP